MYSAASFALPNCNSSPDGAIALTRTYCVFSFIAFSPAFAKSRKPPRLLSYACLVFWERVHHSKFSIRLSDFIPLMWFTQGRFFGLSTKCVAISRCNKTVFVFPPFDNATSLYPKRLTLVPNILYWFTNLEPCCLGHDTTFPRLSIRYSPSSSDPVPAGAASGYTGS